MDYLNETFELEPGNMIIIEDVRPKEAKMVISFTHTYTLRRTVADKKEKLDKELNRMGQRKWELKWYLSGDSYEELHEWRIS